MRNKREQSLRPRPGRATLFVPANTPAFSGEGDDVRYVLLVQVSE